MANTTTVQIGTLQRGQYYATLTVVLDVNDRVTYFVRQQGIKIDQPEKVYVRGFNLEVPGETVSKFQYKNRHVQLSLNIRASNAANVILAVRKLIQAIETPGYWLNIQPPGSTTQNFAQVVSVKHKIPLEALQMLSGTLLQVEVDFEIGPFFYGQPLVLDNLVTNPGFEAPSALPITAFNDSFANGSAYTASSLTYSQLILADTPYAYYKLNEPSGTTLIDSSGNGHNGTYFGTVGYSATSLITGSADNAISFDGTSTNCYVNPFGAAFTNFTIELWCKDTGMGSTQGHVFMATNGTYYVNVKISDNVVFYEATGGIANSTSIAHSNLNQIIHVAITYNGSTGATIFYLNGVPVGTGTTNTGTFTFTSFQIGYYGTYFTGVIDEPAVYNYVLNADKIYAHYQTGIGLPRFGASSNTLTILNGTTATFGSPAWGPFSLWQVRFQFQSSANINFSFHGGTATNVLYVSVISTTMSLIHTIAGTAYTLGSQAITLANGSWYWLQMRHIYQSGSPIWPPILQVTLLNDAGGTLGTVIANIGLGAVPVTAADTVTALQGRPNISVSGAAVLIGGAFNNVNLVQLFGPGGWLTEVNSVGNTPASLAWDAATTYPNGPATSNYAARIDAPPGGTWGADFSTAFVGGVTGSPVPIGANQSAHALFWCKSTGLSGAAVITLLINEYDGNATYLRTTTTTLLGNQTSWTKLQLDWMTGSNAAFAAMQCRVSDTSAPGASANATVWYDNVQCWNDTYGSTMPYCELRFPMAPAQLLVSGLIGDVPAPAFFAIGLNVASWAVSGSINLWMGRRAHVGNAILVKPPQAATIPVTFDTGSYGGFYIGNVSANDAAPTGLSVDSANGLGYYHIFARGQTANGVPTSVQLRATSVISQSPYAQGSGQAIAVGPFVVGLFAAANTWTTLDVGQIAVPGVQLGVFAVPQSTYNSPQPQRQLGGPPTDFSRGGFSALLPVDAEVFVATLLNPSWGSTQTNRWIYAYWDGIANGVLVSNESFAVPNWLTPLGTTGSSIGTYIAINTVGDLVARVDPTLVNTVGATPNVGVNQFVVIANDQNNTLLPVAVSLAYQPAFLWPR